MYSVQMTGANLWIDDSQIKRNHTRSSAEEFWRFTLLKYYKPDGKHSSARTVVMTPSKHRVSRLPLVLIPSSFLSVHRCAGVAILDQADRGGYRLHRRPHLHVHTV